MRITVETKQMDADTTVTIVRAPMETPPKSAILEALEDAINVIVNQYERPVIPRAIAEAHDASR